MKCNSSCFSNWIISDVVYYPKSGYVFSWMYIFLVTINSSISSERV